MGMILFGNISNYFVSIFKALASIVGLAIGALDTTVWTSGDPGLTAAFLTFYYFFLIFLLITVFASIYIDNYRQATMELGSAIDGGPKVSKAINFPI
jgi:hypothetical protein